MKRLLMISGGLLFALSAQAFAAVDFEKEIRPIFAATCYKCHAGSKHKGELKLDSVEAIKKGGKEAGSKAVIPGNGAKSDMIRRLSLPKDDDDVMPPDGKGDHLTKAQIDLIKKWIDEGANFGKWTKDDVKESPSDTKSGE